MILSGIRISEVLLYVCSDNFINYCFIEYIYLVTGELCGDLFCYNVSSEARNWDEANTSCTEMGMSLALRNIIDDFSTVLSNSEGHFWIGLRREVGQSNLIWNDGVMFSSTIEVKGMDMGMGMGMDMGMDMGMGNSKDCINIHNDKKPLHLHHEHCNSESKVNRYICQRMNGTGENTS